MSSLQGRVDSAIHRSAIAAISHRRRGGSSYAANEWAIFRTCPRVEARAGWRPGKEAGRSSSCAMLANTPASNEGVIPSNAPIRINSVMSNE